jgi:hypothetical protein
MRPLLVRFAVVACALLVPVAVIARPHALAFDLKALNGSGESGTATITKNLSGQLVITLTLTGEPAGVHQPAHIHPGTCANVNPVPKAILTDVVDGKSVTMLPAPSTPPAGARAIVVHKGPGADANVYVACGDIPSQ